MPQISVIIPIYNVEKFLNQCIRSVISQSFNDIEIICVNDGSSDNSLKILQRYADIDKRIVIISQRNQGLSVARNNGINAAKGKYLCFLDSDDMLAENNSLKILFETAEKNQVQVVSYETELYYECEELKRKEDKDQYYLKSKKYSGVKSGKEYFIEMILNDDYCESAWLLFINREWLLNNRILFYPGIYYEDVLFSLQCFLSATRMVHIDQRLYIYRVREGSIMTKRPRYENVKSRMINYREILKMLFRINDSNERLQRALVKYAKMIAEHLKLLDDYSDRSDEKHDLSPIDALLESAFEVGQKRLDISENIILTGLDRIIEGAEGIVLYGAGKLGRKMLAYLRVKGFDDKIVGFAVSKIDNNQRQIEGIPVICIEAVLEPKHLILLTAKRDFQIEMKRTLQKLDLSNYEVIDRYTERMITEYVQKEKEH